MAAVWTRFRVELRSHWRGWVMLAIVAGVAGGFVVTASAGARRTDSALARHLVAFRFPHATAGVALDDWRRTVRAIRGLPHVEASAVVSELGYCARDAHNRPVIDVGPEAVGFHVNIDGREGVALRRPKLLAGRVPNPARPREILIDSRAAARFGVGAGDVLPIRIFREGAAASFRCDPRDDRSAVGRRIDLLVAGVKTSTGPLFPAGTVTLTPAFDRIYGRDGFYFDRRISVRLSGGAADVPAFRAAVAQIAGAEGVDATEDEAAKIQRSIHHQAQALRLAAAVGGLLALVLLAQALARWDGFAALERPTLRALGMTRHQLVALGAARAATIAALAAVLAAVVAAALAPLTPIGIARELEPDPGFAFDALTVSLGSAAVFALVLLAGAVASARGTRAPAAAAMRLPGASPPFAPADALARWGLPPTVVSGVRMALVRSGGPAAVPVGATLVSAVAAVAVVATALTFTASLDHLFSTPQLYGQTFDYRSEYPFLSEDAVRADDSISDAARGNDKATIFLDGRPVGAVAMQDVKGKIGPVVTEGREPGRRDEILLASKTLDALGLDVGATVEARVKRSARLRIVGRGIVPEGISNELGKGAWLTLAAYRRLDPDAEPFVFQARIAPGADREETLARLELQHVTPAPGPPRTIADFGGVDELPLVVSALLAAMAAATLAHTLATATRRRRRNLAILKTLGFDRRQVFAAVAWQATTFATVGLLVGLPLGVAAGRWTWHLFAEQIGVIPEPVTPLPSILLVIPAAVLLANLVAVLPARSGARTRPAVVLRAE